MCVIASIAIIDNIQKLAYSNNLEKICNSFMQKKNHVSGKIILHRYLQGNLM